MKGDSEFVLFQKGAINMELFKQGLDLEEFPGLFYMGILWDVYGTFKVSYRSNIYRCVFIWISCCGNSLMSAHLG